ncbi:MAG: peptide ABC transporter substrate-binding protein, partial [Spirochaetales bacterium]|nr:peptide ABC transporter substrate-binding protein [Spirochaetales bacterium]
MRLQKRLLHKILINAVCLTFILAFGASRLSAAVPPKIFSPRQLIEQNHLVVAFDMNEEPLSFNPHLSTNINRAQVFTALTEGLVVYNPQTMNPIPGNAESNIASEDHTVWTIKVRKDARFSNGDPITARTYRDSWIHMLTPGNPGDLANLLDMVKGVKNFRTGKDTNPEHIGIKLKDLYTLEIELITPSPYLLKILCHHAFTPVHPANLMNQDRLGPKTFVSSGAFRIAESSKNVLYLEKNPYYWDLKSVELDTIRIELRPSSMKLISEFSEGQVHWSEAYLDIPLLLDQDALQIFPEYSTSFFYFSAISGPYADPAVRRALALLIPWDHVRDVSASIFKTDSLIPQDFNYRGSHGIFSRDKTEAMQILREAGFPAGEGLPTMEIAIYPNAELEKMTDIITDVWSKELGITIIIDVVPYSYYINKSDHPYTMAYLTWIGDFYDPFSFLSLWTSDSSFNPGKYHNTTFDDIIDRALKQPDEEKRYELFIEAEKLLLDTAVVIPISHGVSVNFVDTNTLKGWYPNLLNIHPFKQMSLTSPKGKN